MGGLSSEVAGNKAGQPQPQRRVPERPGHLAGDVTARRALRAHKPPPPLRTPEGHRTQGTPPRGTGGHTPWGSARALGEPRGDAHTHTHHTPTEGGVQRPDARASRLRRAAQTLPWAPPRAGSALTRARSPRASAPTLHVHRSRRASARPLLRRAGGSRGVGVRMRSRRAAPSARPGGWRGRASPRAAVAVRLRRAPGAPAGPAFPQVFYFFSSRPHCGCVGRACAVG